MHKKARFTELVQMIHRMTKTVKWNKTRHLNDVNPSRLVSHCEINGSHIIIEKPNVNYDSKIRVRHPELVDDYTRAKGWCDFYVQTPGLTVRELLEGLGVPIK